MYTGDPVKTARDWMKAMMPVWALNKAHYYSPLNEQPFLKDALYSRGFQRIYGKEAIDQYFAGTSLPQREPRPNGA
jgi:hypothetical protein